eukprot:UN32734
MTQIIVWIFSHVEEVKQILLTLILNYKKKPKVYRLLVALVQKFYTQVLVLFQIIVRDHFHPLKHCATRRNHVQILFNLDLFPNIIYVFCGVEIEPLVLDNKCPSELPEGSIHVCGGVDRFKNSCNNPIT